MISKSHHDNQEYIGQGQGFGTRVAQSASKPGAGQ